MSVLFIIRFSNSRPNTAHEFIMMLGAIVKAAVCFPKRVGLLASRHKVTFRRESRDNTPFFPTARKITHCWSAHGYTKR